MFRKIARLRVPLPAAPAGLLGGVRAFSSCWPSAPRRFRKSRSATPTTSTRTRPIVDRARSLGIMSIFAIFMLTAFVANVIVRDDETGFGPHRPLHADPQVRLPLRPLHRRLRRRRAGFLGVPLGLLHRLVHAVAGSGEARAVRLGDYLYAYFVLALPTLLVTAPMFFALATVTRSMMCDLCRRRRLPRSAISC